MTYQLYNYVSDEGGYVRPQSSFLYLSPRVQITRVWNDILCNSDKLCAAYLAIYYVLSRTSITHDYNVYIHIDRGTYVIW